MNTTNALTNHTFCSCSAWSLTFGYSKKKKYLKSVSCVGLNTLSVLNILLLILVLIDVVCGVEREHVLHALRERVSFGSFRPERNNLKLLGETRIKKFKMMI